jgi:hypothetical protein
MFGVLWIVSTYGWAGQHLACSQPVEDFSQYPGGELEQIAATCESPVVSQLFYHRAHFREIEQTNELYEDLIAYRPQEERHHQDSYRIFIGLVEAMVRQRWVNESVKARERHLGELIRVYEVSEQIAEMRLRGFDLQARALERRLWAY